MRCLSICYFNWLIRRGLDASRRKVALAARCGVGSLLIASVSAAESKNVNELLGNASQAFEWAYSMESDDGHRQNTRVLADGRNRRIEILGLRHDGIVVSQSVTVVTAEGSRRLDVRSRSLSIAQGPGANLSPEIRIHPFFLGLLARYPSAYLLPPYFVRIDPLMHGGMNFSWPEQASVSDGSSIAWLPEEVVVSGIRSGRKLVHDLLPLKMGWSAQSFVKVGDDGKFLLMTSFKVIEMDQVELLPGVSVELASKYQFTEYDEQSGEVVMNWTCTSTAWKWSDSHDPELFEIPLHLADEVRVVPNRESSEKTTED